MISKPPAAQDRERAAITATRTAAVTGMAAARAGGHAVRGTVCYGFAALWGFAALAAGAAGSLPTFVGVGLMALGVGWAGRRAFRRAATSVRTGRGAIASPASAVQRNP